MDISDSLLKNDKHKKNIKYPNMFKNLNESTPTLTHDLETIHKENLAKITVRFNSNTSVLKEENTKQNLIDATKQLIENHQKVVTKPLFDLVEQYKLEDEVIEEKIEEILNIEEKNKGNVLADLDIDELIKHAEKELLDVEDKKSLLETLIKDVSFNSQKGYDDTIFEKNLKLMMQETKEDISPQIRHEEQVVIENEEVKPHKKRRPFRKLLFFLMFVFLIFDRYISYDVILVEIMGIIKKMGII